MELHDVTAPSLPELKLFSQESFEVLSFEDEIRVDELCVQLLQTVKEILLHDGSLDPLESGSICLGADYFLREFIIAESRDNLLQLPPERVRQFAGHWYIVRNVEPNIDELRAILNGIRTVYQVMADRGLVDRERAAAIDAACSDTDWYRQRIDDFWSIVDDGYLSWRDACPLPGTNR